jgi:SAM-dependent methyltransferase
MVERLLSQEELADDKPIPLNVVRCTSCGFVQLVKSPLPADFYRSYDKSAAHSQKMQTYQDELAAEITERFDLTGKTVLEAGCGDGYFAHALMSNDVKVCGVDPGGAAVRMARGRGVSVVEDELNLDLPLEEGSFDAIVARQVLSHVEDLHKFAEAASHYLASGGLAIIEVPDVNQAIAKRRYFDFFADYVNYFSADSMLRLFVMHGLELIEMSPRMSGDYLLAVFRKPEAADLIKSFETFRTDLRALIDAENEVGRKVACWGAGGRGVSLLVMAGLGGNDIEYVIDSAPEKQGHYLPGSQLPVVAPDTMADNPVDTIVVTALMFQDEIISTLVQEFQYTGRVILLSPNPHITDISN